MSSAVSDTLQALVSVPQALPIGTNLALLHLLWALVSGALLPSRGAIFPALQALGLVPAAVRRAWSALRSGAWQIDQLLDAWQARVQADGRWCRRVYDGYRPLAVDTVAFFRPRLKDCPTRHYHPQAGKALPAIVLGLIGRVGHVVGQRVALLTDLVRADPTDPSEAALRRRLLAQVAQRLTDDEVAVMDAGFKLSEVQAARLPRWLVRLALNATARRNQLPDYDGHGRPPEYGALVRPLARTYHGHHLAATPADRSETWTEDDLTFRVAMWDNLVLPNIKVSSTAQTFHIAAVYDPRFSQPWLLASPLRLSGRAWRGLYGERWAIEQVPLVSKQLLGGARQFVSAADSCQRLPELLLMVGSILSYLAATLPAVPTGFWDRHPKPSAGRLRRVLAQAPFPDTAELPAAFRKKASMVDHLPKGSLAHRRTKAAASPG